MRFGTLAPVFLALGLAACSGSNAEEPDAGTPPAKDGTAVALDTGVLPDAEAPDLGAPDLGVAEDSAVAVDAGFPEDAGLSPDAGFGADAGFGPDATAPDGGFLPDAQGPADAGFAPDASQLADGGFAPDAMTGADSGIPGLNPGWIGGSCQSDADCPFSGGRCLENASGWPGGTCTEDCTRTCPDQTGPLNSVTFCIDDGNGDANGLCLSRCDFTLSPTGCRDGYVCLADKRMSQPSVVRHVCVPPSGVPGRPIPAFDIGDSCATDSDCNRSTCLTSMPGGYCTQESCQVVGCPTGSRCFNIGGTEDYYACIQDCTSSAMCRMAEGYACDTDSTCWPTPPPPGVCDLNGGASDCSPYAAQASTDFVVVTKHLRRITLCQGATARGSYCVGLGSAPVGDKEREGDRRTPEGVFYIPRRLPTSQYYKAFLISYPDASDAARGLSQGIITQAEYNAIIAAQNARTEPPQNTGLGGLVEIHGNGSGADWTWGCVAADDTTIDVLWPVLGVGDTVVILP